MLPAIVLCGTAPSWGTISFSSNTLTYSSTSDLSATIDPSGQKDVTNSYGVTKSSFQALTPQIVAFNGAPAASQTLRYLVANYDASNTVTFTFPADMYNYGSVTTSGRGSFSGSATQDAISTVPTHPDSLYDWFDATIDTTGGRGVQSLGFCVAFRSNQAVAAGEVLYTLSDASTDTVTLPALGGSGNPEYVFIGYTAPAGKTITRVQASRTSAAGGGYVAIDDLSWVMSPLPQPTVTLSRNNATIAEAAGVCTLTATLDRTSTQTVTVNLGYTGMATSGTDYSAASSITVNAGQLSGTTNITATQDTVYEGNETIVVDITSVTNADENGTQQVSTTITDDDGQPSVTLSRDNATIAEAAGVSTLTATLSNASTQNVTVNLGYTGMATPGTDYSAASSITVTAGQLTGTTNITATQDSSVEDDETVVVDITSVTNGTESGTQQVTVTITDDDSSGITPAGVVDTTTKGTWKGVYGSDGHILAAFTGPVGVGGTDVDGRPSYISSYNVSGLSRYHWATDTSDAYDLQQPSGSLRNIGCWYTFTSGTITLVPNQSRTFLLRVYLRDQDNYGRWDTLSFSGAGLTGTDTHECTAGKWITYTVTATAGTNIVLTLERQAGENGVISALLFDPVAGSDTTEPATIADLAAGSPTASSLTLTWHAPGDDGSTGTADHYDIRYRTDHAISTTNDWDTATQVSNPPSPPQGAGGQETKVVTGLSAGMTYHFAIKTADEVPNWSGIATASGTTSSQGGSGTGLQGEYFNNMDLTSLALTRTDATVDFDWGTGSPDASVGADTFSVRWTGQVQAQYSETYTFYTVSDDGVRLSVNGQQLVNNWTDHSPIENSGTIALQAGQQYSITMEFYENGGGTTARLLWSSASTPKAVIPQAQLYPATGGGDTTAPATITDLAASNLGPPFSSNSIRLTWTKPGDDDTGGGAAHEYDIRYRTDHAITTSNDWDTATPLDGEPTPQAPPGTQTWDVPNLSPHTAYWFAMKTADEAVPPNWSGLSTGCAGSTVGGTNAATFVSQSVQNPMTAGQTYTVSVTMHNGGTNPWSEAAQYRLGSQNLQDNYTWGMNRVTLGGGEAIAPGQDKTFSWTVTAPSTPGTYNFQWKMVQDGVEWFEPLSTNVAVTVNSGGGDSTKPATIIDLATSNPTSNSIRLTWTAPGDDGAGGGAAHEYDIRYSDSQITTDAQFNSATPCTGEPDPLDPPGGQQSWDVPLPSPSHTYWFAIKTADEVPNWSLLSNTVSGTTTAGGGSVTYYVDAVSGNDNNNGTSTGTAWRTLTKVSNTTFQPGDSILLKRGQTFSGMAWPKGSGSSGSPITLGDYSTGNLPIISGGSNQAAVKLFNQEYWVIQNIETTGGNPYGIYIGGNTADRTWNYFRITNCKAHNVNGEESWKEEGCIIVNMATGSTNQSVNDVVIDGCTAYSTHRWSGIMLNNYWMASNRNSNITIRNCTVYDIHGDGITVFGGSNVLLENNVVYDIGIDPVQDVGTPNGLWTWRTNTATIQFNEVYATHSPGIDGGAFDIDYYNNDHIVQYNYAHDCDAYGVAILGANGGGSGSPVTTNSVVRYNIFSNNGRQGDDNGAGLGEFFVFTWNGGSVDGVQIYNNTSYWNPAANYAAFRDAGAAYSGTRPRFFKNNLIYSTASKFLNASNNIALDHNLYWYTGAGSPEWFYNGANYTSFTSYQSGSGQDAHGQYANPLLNDPTYHANGMPTTSFTLQSGSPAVNAGTDVGGMGTRDFFGNTIPKNGAYDIGANESP